MLSTFTGKPNGGIERLLVCHTYYYDTVTLCKSGNRHACLGYEEALDQLLPIFWRLTKLVEGTWGHGITWIETNGA